MVVSLRGVKAATRRYRGGLRASLDPSTLKAAAHGVSPNCLCSAKIICVLKTQAFQSELREVCQPPERSR